LRRTASAILDLVAADRPVTIDDLLRHTSGITYDYIGGKLIEKAYMASGLFDRTFDNAVFAERIAKLPLARQPGTLGVTVIPPMSSGRIIEIVSGQTLYQFEKQHTSGPARHGQHQIRSRKRRRTRADGGAAA
jgi:CubicO group peptidase (beta-lactamase class C family)